MVEKRLENSFHSIRKGRRFGWFSVILAFAANVLIFLSISWVNRAPAAQQPEDYTVIELFKPELIPENTLPEIDSVPVIVETEFQPKPEPMKLTRTNETMSRPRLVEWMPDSLLQQPGVGIDISLTEIASPSPMDSTGVDDTLSLNQVDRPPSKISGDPPIYPLWFKSKKMQSEVTLRFVVGVDGKVYNIKVHSIRGDERFAIAAEKAVEKWLFKPAINRGKPVPVWCFQKIQFKFDD